MSAAQQRVVLDAMTPEQQQSFVTLQPHERQAVLDAVPPHVRAQLASAVHAAALSSVVGASGIGLPSHP